MQIKYAEQLVNMMSILFEENKSLKDSNDALAKDYLELSEKYEDLMDEYEKLTSMVTTSNSTEFQDIDESDSYNNQHPDHSRHDPVPVENMATEIPMDKGIFQSPASAVHSMVTGTTDQKCVALTAVLGELEQGVSVSKKVLIDQKLFEYRIDERGHNRYLPTDWFREYSVSHGILAEFTGHITKDDKDIKFRWYKVTPYGKDIIKDTATGDTVWKKFNHGPSDWDGYIPVKKNN